MEIYTGKFVKVEIDRKNQYFIRNSSEIERKLREAKNLIVALPTEMLLPKYNHFFSDLKNEQKRTNELREDILIGMTLEVDGQGRRKDLENEVENTKYPMKLDLLNAMVGNTPEVFIAVITDDELRHIEMNRSLRSRFKLFKK